MPETKIINKPKGSAYECECGKIVYFYRKKLHIDTFYHKIRVEKQAWVDSSCNLIKNY
jgi:hypothetical protein